MTDISPTIPAADAIGRPSRNSIAAGVLAAIVVAGDLLFWQHEPGLSLFLFFALLAAGVIFLHGHKAPPLRLAALVAIAVLSMLPLVEAGSPWAVLAAQAGLGLLALGLTGLLPRFEDWAGAFFRFGLLAPVRFIGDALMAIANGRGIGTGGRFMRGALVWLVPAICALVFVALFTAANPVFEIAVRTIRIDEVLKLLDPGRMIFWGVLAALSWPFLAPRLLGWTTARPMQGPVLPRAESVVFGSAAILNSLILFNALFAVQTVLDLVYLWGGVRLPDEMTYAQYAHRGAYPLIATALLAGAFVLAAMRKDGPGVRSPLIRGLVYLWVAQNIWLVISSLLRLKLYVEQYQLSEMRIAAGIWMILVALGLVLIVAKIALDRSNRWLVMSNLLALTITFWAVSWLDLPAIISRYNVQHSSEVTGQGVPVDLYYLLELGPGTVPALDEFIVTAKGASPERLRDARLLRNDLASRLLDVSPDGQAALRPLDWRSWSWREARLRDYLQTRMFAPEPEGGRN